MSEKKMTMGVIVGNRGFFPDQLAKSGREEMIQALAKAGMDCVVLGPEDSKHGAVETHEEAKRCAALFQKNRERLDGVIVSLPNFGDERAIADTLRLARLDVPVLVQATPDDASKMTILHRRDSFCGKMSACNNLQAVRHSLFADQAAYGQPRLGGFSERPGVVCGGMPRRQRHAQPARRQHRSAADRVQYRPLQREVARSARHLHRDARSVRSVWPHRQVER